MQRDGQTRIIRIEGVEPTTIPLEEYANFLRDLVFIHDRLWLIGLKQDFPTRLYYSSFFYVRDRPRVSHPLQLISTQIGSPFKLDVDVNVGDWFKGAASAFMEVLRGVATLPSYIEKAKQEVEQNKLKTRQMRVETQLSESVARETKLAIRDSTAARSIKALDPGDIVDWQARLAPLEKDIQRLSESPLKITKVDELSESTTDDGQREEETR
jgi:hypothetical protein